MMIVVFFLLFFPYLLFFPLRNPARLFSPIVFLNLLSRTFPFSSPLDSLFNIVNFEWSFVDFSFPNAPPVPKFLILA